MIIISRARTTDGIPRLKTKKSHAPGTNAVNLQWGISDPSPIKYNGRSYAELSGKPLVDGVESLLIVLGDISPAIIVEPDEWMSVNCPLIALRDRRKKVADIDEQGLLTSC